VLRDALGYDAAVLAGERAIEELGPDLGCACDRPADGDERTDLVCSQLSNPVNRKMT